MSHYADAEYALEKADREDDDGIATYYSLAAIGHALLAIADVIDAKGEPE